MQLITRKSRALFFVLCLLAGTAWAALPDPITFGWAVERGDINKVKSWLDEGLDPEFQSNQIGSGLMIAAWYGNIEMMALFIERGANTRRANRNGEQPLQLAAWNGHLEAVKWLLERGAALNREGNYWGALHYAVFNGHQELAKYLIERGAEVNARSPNGSTPLILAAREGREDLTKVLLESGADTKSKNDWGDNALTMAMRYDHYRLGKMISSPEEFEIAVKAPKESFGEASRSASAPSEIEELLRKIREAEAEGKPSEALHKQLLDAVNAFRRNAVQQKSARRAMPLPYMPKTIVITGSRRNPGAERAQVMVDGKTANLPVAAKAATKTPSITVTPVNQRATQARIAELMRQIRLAEAEGRPANDLRQQLYEAVESLKQ
ncbi:ankyrin repeat domain-containing protein [Propionivibrio sp.]|uniref:ankyrin repeat domain-containing protein n=1 Tax=Propionivibrio sp. TaxID=2212460 RepID=UPI003BF3E036